MKTLKRTREEISNPMPKKLPACVNCHASHKKCDRRSPCTTCVQRGLKCQYVYKKRSTIQELQREVQELKKIVAKYQENAESKNNDASFSMGQTSHQNEISYDPNQQFYDKRWNIRKNKKENPDFAFHLLSVDVTLYLNSIVCTYLNVYYMTCYPHHFLVPDNFQDCVPELMERYLRTNSKDKETYLLFSVIANSALIVNDAKRSSEFLYKTLDCEQYIDMSTPDYVIGCSYAHLSYFFMCQGQMHKAYHYSKLAKQVTDALGLQHTDLHGESLMKIGYTSPDYNERISSFLDCYSRDKFTDKAIGILGLVHTELDFNPNPDYKTLLDILHKSQSKIPLDWRYLFTLYTHALLASTYRRAGLYNMAKMYADKISEIANSNELRYSCVVVSTFAMKEATEMHFKYKQYDAIDNDLRIIGTFCHYDIGYALFEQVSEKLNQCQPNVHLNLNLNEF